MKILLMRIIVSLGIFSLFNGLAGHFEVHAKEDSSQSGAEPGDTMGTRTGGCGKCT